MQQHVPKTLWMKKTFKTSKTVGPWSTPPMKWISPSLIRVLPCKTLNQTSLARSELSKLLSPARSKQVFNSPITSALQASLLPGPKDSIGAKILKKMGWRLGQGIGPRISLRRRKEQDAQAYDPISGTKMTSGSLNLPQDDEEADKHFYAPRDTPVLAVNRKDNTHGLGYVPNLTLQERLGNSSSGGTSGPRLAGTSHQG